MRGQPVSLRPSSERQMVELALPVEALADHLLVAVLGTLRTSSRKRQDETEREGRKRSIVRAMLMRLP